MTISPDLNSPGTIPGALQAAPRSLADVALIDGPTCAAAGQASVSWWLEEVRTGRAPAPVIRKPRFTRCLCADVVAFWHHLAAKAAADVESAAQVTSRAKKASVEARTPAAVAKAQATRAANKASAASAAGA